MRFGFLFLWWKKDSSWDSPANAVHTVNSCHSSVLMSIFFKLAREFFGVQIPGHNWVCFFFQSGEWSYYRIRIHVGRLMAIFGLVFKLQNLPIGLLVDHQTLECCSKIGEDVLSTKFVTRFSFQTQIRLLSFSPGFVEKSVWNSFKLRHLCFIYNAASTKR